jgi:hypothetical protein
MSMKTNASALVLPASPPDGATNDIRGIKAPVEIPSAWTWLWWTLALLALAALAWWGWTRWRKKKKTASLPPVVPPHERALERLREALALIDQPRPFCTSVSDAIRAYLEERFNLRAPERTTEEFLDELQNSAVLSLDQKQSLGEFLMRCDLVKFARYEPGEPELRGLYDAAIRLIDETQPPPPLPDEANAATPDLERPR